MDFSEDCINLEDVMVIEDERKIKSDQYTNKTDTHQFLDAQSCHRYVNTVVYNVYTISAGNKIKRMCSNEHALELHVWLTKCSYKSDVITKQNEKNRFY